MKYRFEYLPYRRKFRRPLVTAHGTWEYREGIVVRLEREDGVYGFGEIAPVPWFGTETFGRALDWCREQDSHITVAGDAPSNAPCCQWALYSAIEAMEDVVSRAFPVVALMGSAEDIATKQAAGFQTFKIKIGVADLGADMARVDEFIGRLDDGQRLRLDANGGLSERDYKAWLEYLEGKPAEYLEQPLGLGLEVRMLEIAEPFSTAIALDESIAGMESLTRWQNWPGPLVVKPSLLGWIEKDFLFSVVGSSVFETAFGFEAALRFLACYQKTDIAIGFDMNAMLEEDEWSLHGSSSSYSSGEMTNAVLQALWEDMQ